MSKYFFTFFITISLLFSSCSSFQVIPVNEDFVMEKKEGIFYSLPRTKIMVDVIVEKHKRIKGPYHKYASKYLGLRNVISKNTVYYKLGDITISRVAERDPEQVYFVEMGKQKDKMMINLSESGLICSVNKKLNIGVSEQNDGREQEESDDRNELFKYFAETNLREKVDTVIELINLDTITIEKKILKKSLVEKSREQKAKEAADFIMRVKEDRYNLIMGYAEVDYEQGTLSKMNDELEKLEKEYITLFTGFTTTQLSHHTFSYVPKSGDEGAEHPIFSFSFKDGIYDDVEPSGSLVSLKLTTKKETNKIKSVLSQVTEDSDVKKGFFYRIPETATVSVMHRANVLSEAELLINQYGVINSLPVSQQQMMFFPKVGSLQNLGHE